MGEHGRSDFLVVWNLLTKEIEVSDFKLYGPFDIELKIRVTDGEQLGAVVYSLGRAQYATPEKVAEALAKTEASVKAQMGDEWRLCTKQEYFNEMMREETGMGERFAMPCGDDWDVLSDE